jgi:carbon-monoxide dehydrogenase medium subunit
VDEVVARARSVISPISDVRCTREYREHMVEVYVRRTLQEVA